MQKLLVLILMVATGPVSALGVAGAYVDPHVAVGFNPAQGTAILLGADLGYQVTDQVSAGVGVYGTFGRRPGDDRELGGGPFVAFVHPLTPFLTAHVREHLAYVDQRVPVTITRADGGEKDSYDSVTGVASITTLGVHITITPNLGVSAGYRAVLGLSNSDLGKERSMPYFGFSIGI